MQLISFKKDLLNCYKNGKSNKSKRTKFSFASKEIRFLYGCFTMEYGVRRFN